MVKLAIAGTSEFTVGFQLAGIKDIIEISGNSFNELRSFKGRKDIGVVVVDERIMDSLEMHQKIEIENSVDPVFIPVSTRVEQDSLRRLTRKSVGVDLWK